MNRDEILGSLRERILARLDEGSSYGVTYVPDSPNASRMSLTCAESVRPAW